jgi:pilT protein domain protein
VRRELTAANRKIGDMDMLIAANVLSRGCTLVTNNEKDFKNISGPKIENWT